MRAPGHWFVPYQTTSTYYTATHASVEGTICPISFVKETLFPYALTALPAVLESKWDSEEFKPYKDAFPEEARTSPQALQAHVEDLTKRDVKVAYLKNLQGYLWETGYKTGAYGTPLFDDVVPKLKEWKKAGVELAIYSSGSVFAQKLLFGHVQVSNASSAMAESQTEDLQSLISDWFDTTNAGPKTEANSYMTILGALECIRADFRDQLSPMDVLFFSDNIKECDAAVAAGMRSVIVERPGNEPIPHRNGSDVQHRTVKSLDEVQLS
ncbi:enolase-phosphatase E1 [Saxophila tyrrhenica]|uniref:Enolase-phosphatase E1 n=1 Tax=Saxophila tyrrhenica TaxID=1690608 RepID=A0AAV9PG20_9PEZI|nr:enolase-phosphatase E1 [Saxophila tyrrhenica]